MTPAFTASANITVFMATRPIFSEESVRTEAISAEALRICVCELNGESI